MSASLYISRKKYSLRGGMGSAGRGIRQRAVPTLTVTEYSGLGSLWQKSRGRCGGFAYRCLRPRTRPIVVETRSYLVQYCIVSTPRSGCDAAAHQLSGLLPKAARSLQNGGLGSAWRIVAVHTRVFRPQAASLLLAVCPANTSRRRFLPADEIRFVWPRGNPPGRAWKKT